MHIIFLFFICSTFTVNDIFNAIKALCTPVSFDVTRIEVRRSSVLLDGLKEVGKQKFKPCNTLKVFVVIQIYRHMYEFSVTFPHV